MKLKFLIISLLAATVMACSHTGQTNSNAATATNTENGVYFANLKNGDTVKNPVIIQMGVRGMDVEPAGAYHEGKGHHHLIIDGSFVAKGDVVPKDATHIHFGKGQTTDTLTLAPGQHTLTLQFADGMHRSYGEKWSSTIKVTVAQ